ncbi:Hypothetical predicted protein [Olea europaea subsp. europaea]|uniref:DUF4283 domain-containing protein n=1 Tax=Olea europaea subsp. europaea TaxID=158383 RepID=A0A8S0UAV4_OLEEU|nr:Hypothetical predicted protein [Olea europaea subsp. europaea]
MQQQQQANKTPCQKLCDNGIRFSISTKKKLMRPTSVERVEGGVDLAIEPIWIATMANPRAPPPTQLDGGRATATVTRGRTFADMVVGKPTPLADIEIPWKETKISADGQVWYQFTHEKIQKMVEPLKYAMVIKFLRKRPSVDDIRGYIKARWGLSEMLVIGAMGNPQQVLIRINNEADFVTTCSSSMAYRTDCSNGHQISKKIRDPLLLWY